MLLLLDTHIAIWAVAEPERLDGPVQGWISSPANIVAVSIASLWEIAIKRSVRRYMQGAPEMSSGAVKAAFETANFDLLAIHPDHIEAFEFLPSHYRVPFDRLLVAQAKVEGMTLLTHDKQLAAYGEYVMVV